MLPYSFVMHLYSQHSQFPPNATQRQPFLTQSYHQTANFPPNLLSCPLENKPLATAYAAVTLLMHPFVSSEASFDNIKASTINAINHYFPKLPTIKKSITIDGIITLLMTATLSLKNSCFQVKGFALVNLVPSLTSS